MRLTIPPLILDILCIIIGALLPLAFAPFDYYPLAFLLPALLIPLWSFASNKRAFLRGWLFGIGFFGVGVSWVFVSIHLYGHASILLAGFLTALFVAFLAVLFSATHALTYRYLFPKNNFISWCIGFPVVWALWEWIQTWLLSGFPWNFLSYSQINTPFAGFVPLVGVYGTTALIVFISGLLAYAIFTFYQEKNTWNTSIICISVVVLIFLTGMGLRNISWTQDSNDVRQVSLIQGNIPQEQKWDKKFVQEIIKTYTNLTQQHWNSPLIIWPEAALPIPVPDSVPILSWLDQNAKEHHATIIMGLLEYTGNRQFYNAAIAIGDGSGLYRKRQLVPFGEYVPLENFLRNIIAFFNLPSSHTVAGTDIQPALVSGKWKIMPLICYEIAYPDLARESALDGNIILTISNDTWFGRSIGPKQHLQIAQFRALETGRYVIRATNSGLTAIINPRGKITAIAPAFETTVLTATADSTRGFTPIVQMGHLVIIISLLVLLMASVYFSRRR